MLLGIWKSVAELEEHVTLQELNGILKAYHEQENRHNRFTAALKGINLDEGNTDAKERFDAVQRRVEEKLGKRTEKDDMSELGFEFEVEE